MQSDFIPYARQSISQEDCQQVHEALTSNMITRGPYVEKFESDMATYCGSRYAVAFNSGSTALLAAFHVAKTNSSDRIISTPNTFIASVGPAIRYGASISFVDIDPVTANLGLDQLEVALSKRHSRGKSIIVPVHFAGVAVDMEAVDSLLKDPEAIVIEDACHALGSRYSDGQRVGSCAYSQMTVFSFHPAKTITTGEGGMITTNDEKLCHLLKRFRNNGMERAAPFLIDTPKPWYYEVQELTSGYNFTEFQAALGCSQLQRISAFIEKRRQLVAAYRKHLKGIQNISLLPAEYDAMSAYHLFVTQIDFDAYKTTREAVMENLLDSGIGTQVHYIPLYRHPCFNKDKNFYSEFPNTEAYYAKALSLPLYYDLSLDDVEKVVSCLLTALKKKPPKLR